jgi:hypothetical protein
VAIRLERAERDGDWHVAWTLRSPVTEARFSRGGYENRLSRWTVVTPGVAIVREGAEDRFRSTVGPVGRIEVRIAPYAVKPEKDYQVFVPFTDGDVLVFTGVFDLAPPPGAPSWRNVLTLVPRPGEGVVVGGRRTEGAATWESRGDGTYACLGSASPLETPLGLAVVDRGMPWWLRDRTLALAPRVFALYAERTGVPLAVRPTFFLSYASDPAPGSFSFGGGALDDVVQLDTRLGARFRSEADPGVWLSQARLLAHESAHVWLDHAFEPAPGASRWLDEGGADAFALRALLDLEVVPRESWLALVSAEATSCLRHLEQGPLSDAARAGRWKALYQCGALASLLADALGARTVPPRDLLSFWGEVFRAAPGGVYDEALWLRILETLPEGAGSAALVRRMIAGADPALPADLVTALRAAGVGAGIDGAPPAIRISSWPDP